MKPENHPSRKIVGRDTFIAETWLGLNDKSIYMNDLRRIGKTEILRKMLAEIPPGWIAAFSDLEGTHTAEEFAAMVYKDSATVLGAKTQTMRKMAALLGKAAGAEIMGIIKFPDGQPLPWKDVLRTTFDDIAETLRESGIAQRMVFFWDEVPYLLDNIAKNTATGQGKDTAAQVLDILRELSQRHDNIRLLLTGSIGIHHVLRSLWNEGYKGSPLNHMNLIQPGPLQPEYSVPFAQSEIIRRRLVCEDTAGSAAALAEAVSHVPFYIEKLTARLPLTGSLTPRTIDAALEKELRSDKSDWDLDYYRRRVKAVFGDHERLVLAILDTIAVAPSALSFQEIRGLVNARLAADDEHLREHLKLLCMDHYLVRDDANAYRFYLPLIRRWWTINRSLTTTTAP
jgi:alkylated DNA nucleotide flippase Atl1